MEAPLTAVIDAAGMRLGPSEWLKLDAARLSEFVHGTYLSPGDGIDLTVADANRFGPELVDGFMSVALIMHFNWRLFPFREQGMWALNYGLNRVRFPSPLYVGEAVRATMEITQASRHRFGVLVTSAVTLEIADRSRPALVADWLCLYLSADKAPETLRS
jgi:acyl dehydratase